MSLGSSLTYLYFYFYSSSANISWYRLLKYWALFDVSMVLNFFSWDFYINFYDLNCWYFFSCSRISYMFIDLLYSLLFSRADSSFLRYSYSFWLNIYYFYLKSGVLFLYFFRNSLYYLFIFSRISYYFDFIYLFASILRLR